jgi:hypothetical protein
MRHRLLFLLLVMAPFLVASEGSCIRLDDPSSDEPDDPDGPPSPFLDEFNGGLIQWRTTPFAPNYQMTQGNPLPSLEVGSASGLATGGVTARKFDTSDGLVIEADVFWQAPGPSTTATPQVWIGLSDEDDPMGAVGVAAGMWLDASAILHLQVNGADVGQLAAPPAGSWHKLSTTIRADRVVEFRVDGALRLTAGQVDATYLEKPVEVVGIGYPERPRIDNVSIKVP